LDELQLTYPQYLVLLTLWEKQQLTIKALGDALDLDTGTLTPLLKRMEGAGLLERRRDSVDERVVNIRITEQGKALQEKATCIPQSLIASSGMSKDEIQKLNVMIKHLMQQVNSSSLE
jgi:DNA-binding MarR family transcriptional regulator